MRWEGGCEKLGMENKGGGCQAVGEDGTWSWGGRCPSPPHYARHTSPDSAVSSSERSGQGSTQHRKRAEHATLYLLHCTLLLLSLCTRLDGLALPRCKMVW